MNASASTTRQSAAATPNPQLIAVDALRRGSDFRLSGGRTLTLQLLSPRTPASDRAIVASIYAGQECHLFVMSTVRSPSNPIDHWYTSQTPGAEPEGSTRPHVWIGDARIDLPSRTTEAQIETWLRNARFACGCAQ